MIRVLFYHTLLWVPIRYHLLFCIRFKRDRVCNGFLDQWLCITILVYSDTIYIETPVPPSPDSESMIYSRQSG